mgnify:CR=1 FL=1
MPLDGFKNKAGIRLAVSAGSPGNLRGHADVRETRRRKVQKLQHPAVAGLHRVQGEHPATHSALVSEKKKKETRFKGTAQGFPGPRKQLDGTGLMQVGDVLHEGSVPIEKERLTSC